MPEIPVPTESCESEQDKLLYNIWQLVRPAPMPLIPGIVAPTQPYGWDVNNVTNQLLYNIMLNIGGGGGGSGTVTSIGFSSASLKTFIAPANPITTAGSVKYELQTIPIDRADFITLFNTNQLLPSVRYSINDPQTPLDELYIIAEDVDRYATIQTGFQNGVFVQVEWDASIDRICGIYCPATNARSTRRGSAFYNCIEDFDTTSANSRNSWMDNCNFADDLTGNVVHNVYCGMDSTLQVSNLSNLNTVYIQGGTQVFIDAARVFISTMGGRIILNLNTSGTGGIGDYDSCQWWGNVSQTFTVPYVDQFFQFGLNQNQRLIPLNGAIDTVPDSAANEINVALWPAGVIPVYTLRLPAGPVPNQKVNISSIQNITAFTIDGNGNFITTSITTLPAGQSITFIFDLASGWLQV